MTPHVHRVAILSSRLLADLSGPCTHAGIHRKGNIAARPTNIAATYNRMYFLVFGAPALVCSPADKCCAQFSLHDSQLVPDSRPRHFHCNISWGHSGEPATAGMSYYHYYYRLALLGSLVVSSAVSRISNSPIHFIKLTNYGKSVDSEGARELGRVLDEKVSKTEVYRSYLTLMPDEEEGG